MLTTLAFAQGGMQPGPGTPHSAGGGSPITLVAHTFWSGAGNSGGTTSPAVDMTGANLIVIVVTDACGPGFALSDSSSNTYTRVVNGTTQCGAGADVSIYEKATPTVTSSMTFTTTATTTTMAIAILGFSNANASPFDVGSTNAVGGASCTPGSVTPSQANSLVVSGGSGVHPQSGSITGAAGFTVTDSAAEVTSGSTSILAQYQVQTTATAENPTVGFSSAPATVCSIAVFKP